jgi:carbon storage regulator CsrA
MLVLTRKLNETIVAGDVTITVVRTRADAVRLGIDAPPEVRIRRGEHLESCEAPGNIAADGEAGSPTVVGGVVEAALLADALLLVIDDGEGLPAIDDLLSLTAAERQEIFDWSGLCVFEASDNDCCAGPAPAALRRLLPPAHRLQTWRMSAVPPAGETTANN